MAQVYDDGESYDASDHGEDVVPEGTERELYARLLEALHAAGFREVRP